ncbi:protein of unknown function [Magnetospirillum sp. XM-1]|nr:protein of unknown function [Magnetospirillum sp. XM-1]
MFGGRSRQADPAAQRQVHGGRGHRPAGLPRPRRDAARRLAHADLRGAALRHPGCELRAGGVPCLGRLGREKRRGRPDVRSRRQTALPFLVGRRQEADAQHGPGHLALCEEDRARGRAQARPVGANQVFFMYLYFSAGRIALTGLKVGAEWL